MLFMVKKFFSLREEVPCSAFSVQRSPFRVGRERVKKFNHEGHEEHEGKRRGSGFPVQRFAFWVKNL
jgi:hypothetical protein